MRNQESDGFFAWLWKERYSVTVSFTTALLPMALKGVLALSSSISIPVRVMRLFEDDRIWSLSQCSFILFTLLLLYDYRLRIHRDLVNGKARIIKYINKNCRRKIKTDRMGVENYLLVSTSVRQFYNAWIIVWMLWLVYYLGKFLFSYVGAEVCATIFGNAVDFLTSTVMLLIYIILTDITVGLERRRTEDFKVFWEGVLVWLIIFVFWVVLLIMEICHPERKEYSESTSLLLSVFSSLVFVLVLGKMNSHYLHIPRFFLLVMYVYAIAHAYIPFQGKCESPHNQLLMKYMLPLTTLFGKVFVMLSLCWIVNKKRLIFFLVHRSNAIGETKELLAELDQEPTCF